MAVEVLYVKDWLLQSPIIEIAKQTRAQIIKKTDNMYENFLLDVLEGHFIDMLQRDIPIPNLDHLIISYFPDKDQSEFNSIITFYYKEQNNKNN